MPTRDLIPAVVHRRRPHHRLLALLLTCLLVPALARAADNAVRLGALTTPTTNPNTDPAPFTLGIKGISPEEVVILGTPINVKAKVKVNDDAGTATVTGVRFLLDNRELGEAEGDGNTFKRKVSFSENNVGSCVPTAVLTDNAGRFASASVPFRVAQTGVGSLALDTMVEPADGTAAPGSLVTYTFVVTNTGETFTATNVRVDAKLPKEVLFNRALVLDGDGKKLRIKNLDGSKNPSASTNGRNISFCLGDIPRKESRRAELTVRVPLQRAGRRSPISPNRVDVSGDFGAVYVPAAELPAEVREGEETTQESYYVPALGHGEKITVLLLARNFGGIGADQVTIKDRLPDGFEFVPDGARINERNAGQFLKLAGNGLAFTLPGFQANELAAISYQMVVKARSAGGPALGYVVSDGATIRSLSLTGTANSIPRNLPIRIATGSLLDVQATKFPATNDVGQAKTYYLDYSNRGGKPAKGASVRALLPVGVAFVSDPGGQLQSDGRTVVFPLGDLPGGGGGRLVVNATVTEAAKAQAD